MPGLKHRVGGDEHREVIGVEVVINVGKAAAFEALADDKTIGLEDGEFSGVEPEIEDSLVLPRVGGIPDGRVHAEQIPKLGSSRIKGNLRQILVCRLINGYEVL